jgi:hypothetical protein
MSNTGVSTGQNDTLSYNEKTGYLTFKHTFQEKTQIVGMPKAILHMSCLTIGVSMCYTLAKIMIAIRFFLSCHFCKGNAYIVHRDFDQVKQHDSCVSCTRVRSGAKSGLVTI